MGYIDKLDSISYFNILSKVIKGLEERSVRTTLDQS